MNVLRRFVAWLIRDRSAIRIAVLSGVTTLGLCGVTGLMLAELRRDAWQQAESSSLNILRLASQDAARNVEMFDLSLRAVAEGLSLPGLDKLTPDIRQAVLFDRTATAKYLGAVLVMNEAGDVVQESLTTNARAANFADRDYFAHFRDSDDDQVYISKPYVSSRTGELSIGVSRRLKHPDGSFAGVVMGSMRLDYFRDMFERVSLGRRGVVALFRRDGTLLMRQPYVASDIGRSVGSAPHFKSAVEQNREGTYVATSVIDGVERFYSFTPVGKLPLILNVALATDDILSAWRRKAFVTALVVFGLCGVTVLLTYTLVRELRQRTEAEHRLRNANAELANLAITDPLTGLSNRRKFDETIAREWSRSVRMKAGTALLAVDVDHFKAYNDQYGHGAGDKVLQALASVLGAGASRPADLASRTGGEEFCVILPQTGLDGATAVAERMRAALAALAIPHGGSPAGFVTVSIGIAVARPGPGDEVADFMAAADAALYDAKHAGRNRIAVSPYGADGNTSDLVKRLRLSAA